ncbi:MAG: HesA/MoeB/ThiF family protein [Bacteroidales bacterium]
MANTILTPREIRRYSRQIMIPEVGIAGQEKIRKARVIVVGAGGLGSPVLQYLVAAGVGMAGIAEFDTVDETNLQRQVLYGSDDVGKLKSIIAKERLVHLNSLVEIPILNLRIDARNAIRVFENYDIVVDATDNYEARYVISDACVILGKPMVHGSVYKSEAQVAVFNYNGGPTYRCLHPYVKDPALRDPRAEDAGILGVLAGITGTIMASEVLKIITGTGEILSGKVLLVNTFTYQFTVIKIKSIPENHNIREIQAIY